MTMKAKILALMLLLLPVKIWAATYSVDQVPAVHLTDSTRFVSNPDGILSASAQAGIDDLLRRLMATTTAEVAAVVIDDIPADDDIDDFATALFRKWGLGKSDNENGLLLLVVKDRREVVIRTGYGLEGLLPDGVCGSIIRSEITPRFRQGDYDGGVAGAISAIASIIASPDARDEVLSHMANNAAARRTNGDNSDKFFSIYLTFSAIVTAGLLIWFIMTLIGNSRRYRYDSYRALDRLHVPALFCTFLCLGMPLVVLLPLLYARKRLRRGVHKCPNCDEKMNLVDEEHDNDYLTPAQNTEERINSIDYDVWLCPVCGTTEILPYVQRSTAFTECPRCHARACELVSDSVVRRPTTMSEGVGVRTYRCRHCHNQTQQQYNIAKLPPVIVVPGGGGHGGGFGGGGFGGGSFGGGSTGGGGARGGW